MSRDNTKTEKNESVRSGGNIDLKEAQQWLEHGQQESIAEKHGITKQYASKIMHNKINRPPTEFVAAILDAALKNKATLTSKQKALKEL